MRRPATPAGLLIVLVLAGCVYYPTVADLGGVRIRPQNGRALRPPSGLAVYVDLESTGKDGDTITAAVSEVAKATQLVTTGGQPVARIEVPGAAVVRLSPETAHIVLTDLTRPLASGDVILITLVFEKLGPIGVVTRVE